MHTTMFIWKQHLGKFAEMRKMVMTILDYCRRIRGFGEAQCAALNGSMFSHFSVSLKFENAIETEKAFSVFVKMKHL